MLANENSIVLTKDDAIRRRPAEREALIEAGVRFVFCLTSAQLRGSEQTERFVDNRHRILRQARKPGPYIYGVYEKRIARLRAALSPPARRAFSYHFAWGVHQSERGCWRCKLSRVQLAPFRSTSTAGLVGLSENAATSGRTTSVRRSPSMSPCPMS